MVTTSSAASTGDVIAAIATSAQTADAMNFTCITIPFFAEYQFPAPHLLFPVPNNRLPPTTGRQSTYKNGLLQPDDSRPFRTVSAANCNNSPLFAAFQVSPTWVYRPIHARGCRILISTSGS